MEKLLAAPKEIWANPQQRNITIIVLTLAVATVFAFWNALVEFNIRWGSEEELSHSYFLPLITLWLLWERKDSLAKSLGEPVPIGFVLAGGSLLFTLAGAATHVALAEQLGFVGLLISIPLILGGWSLWKLTIIPLLYLFFMVPPPKMLITLLSQNFQLISSDLGVAMIRMFGIPVFNTGVIIELPSTRLEVEAACSGLNYLFPFISLGALAAYFYHGPWWQRGIIFVSTIPITIFMNSFRIGMTGILTETVGGDHTDGFVHAFEGWMVFLLCILLLIGIIWIMTLLRGKKSPLAFVGFDHIQPIPPKAPWSAEKFTRYGVILTLLVLAFGALNFTVGQRQFIIPERLKFDTLPLEFPNWTSRNAPLSDRVLEVLGADDFILTDMVGPDGQQINLYIAYLEARREGKSWHSPLQCLPGGGWEVSGRESFDAETYDGHKFKLNRMIIRQKDAEMVVHFWYDHRGRKISNEFSMRAWVVWDDLFKSRSDGAMVRLMTRVKEGETRADAEARLTAMRHQLEPILPKYVPN